MVKIKLKLFESIVGAILLPNIGLFFTTLLLIISLIVKQEPIVYKGILISYIVCLSLMILFYRMYLYGFGHVVMAFISLVTLVA